MKEAIQKSNFNCEFYVEGMHCASCELVIEENLLKFNGVKKVDAKLREGKVFLQIDGKLDPQNVREGLNMLIEEYGYKLVDNHNSNKQINWKEILLGLTFALLFFGFFVLIQKLGVVNLASNEGDITLPFIFLIGIIASLSTCMAVVGGLVLSLSSNYAKENQTTPLVIFHISRIIGFFILGGVIGLLGSAFILTSTISFILNLILFLVMMIMALNLLDIFSFTKKLQLKVPKSLGKSVITISKTDNPFTPLLLGVGTFFLPCGFTQSMQLYSLTSGSPISGALTMFVFALGTFPVLALISFISTKFANTLQSGLFFKTAGFIIIFFAIFNFISALVAVGLISPLFNI